MVGQKRIDKILREGLTGWEAGKLLIEDSWEVDHGREGFLSQGDIRRIKSSLTEERDIRVYNSLIETYRLIGFSLKEAHIAALEAVNALSYACRWLWQSWLDTYIHFQKDRLPVIMTEKQHQEQWQAIQEKQRQRLLDDIESLLGVIEWRASELAPEEQREQIEDDSVWTHPELVSGASSQIQELIREGKLRPVYYLSEDRETLQELREQIQAKRDKRWPPDETREELEKRVLGMIQPPDQEEARESISGQFVKIEHRAGSRRMTLSVSDWTAQDQEEFDALLARREELEKEAYLRARESDQELAKILEGLARLAADPEDGEAKALLGHTYCSTEDLYQAGLPEWVGWVDGYKPDLFEGDLRTDKIAIIQDPSPRQLDERGYYDPDYLDWLEELSQVRGLDERLRDNRDLEGGLSKALHALVHKASSYIELFLSFQAVIATVSEVLGIDLTEDLKDWQEHIETEIQEYNGYITGLPHFLTAGQDFPTLQLSAYEPDPGKVEYLRDRIAIGLGEDWWKEVSETVLAREEEADE